MKKSELKSLIRECITEILKESSASFTKLATELDSTIIALKKTAKDWKSAPDAEKSKFVPILKQLTAKKKQLENELQDNIISIDKSAELKVTADME